LWPDTEIMSNRLVRRLARIIDRRLNRFRQRWDAWTLPDFANQPERLNLPSPRTVRNAHLITIGNDCCLGQYATLAPITEFRDGGDQSFTPRLLIGNRVWATACLQVYSAQEVIIEDDVYIAANVFICDCQHGTRRADVPYRRQPLERIAPVRIGRGSWLGQNVVVMPGVTIGEFAVIGANSVVTKSIPARSIAVGSPARVLRTWDETERRWEDAPVKSSR
jgi:acetyltransferase-like isoleucine patch superfamily enzyme